MKNQKVSRMTVLAAAAASALILQALPPAVFAGEQTAEEQQAAEERQAGESEEETVANSHEEAGKTTGFKTVKDYKELYDWLAYYEKYAKQVTTMDADIVYAGSDDIAVPSEENTMENYVEEAVADSSGGTNSAAGGAPADHSVTNTQETGVDEADIIKNDGRYLYILDTDGTVTIVDPSAMKVASQIPFAGGDTGSGMELYVDGAVLQRIYTERIVYTIQTGVSLPSDPEGTKTRTFYTIPAVVTKAETYDISDPSGPVLLGRVSQDGSYLTSRRENGHLYLFTDYTPASLSYPESLDSYVPHVNEALLDTDRMYLPCREEWKPGSRVHLLVAGAVGDQDPGDMKDRIALLTDSEIFYAGTENFYSAISLYDSDTGATRLVRFGYEDGSFSPGSSGDVQGYLNDQFSLSEYEEHLRVVTTREGWRTGSIFDTILNGFEAEEEYYHDNCLYILDKDMNITGSIEGLADGEDIRSARMMGPYGYFVTYRNTDPLFSVDLSDPEAPVLLGELKIPGFSAYLHFWGDDLLLGVGWDTDEDTGIRNGLKCSIFDISDPANVTEKDRLILKDVSQCGGLDNYKSILASPGRGIFSFAYTSYSDIDWTEHVNYGIFSYSGEEGFGLEKVLETDPFMTDIYREFPRLRGAYTGDTFFIVGNGWLKAYDMEDQYSLKGSLRW